MMWYDEQQPVQQATSIDESEALPSEGGAGNATDETSGASSVGTPTLRVEGETPDELSQSSAGTPTLRMEGETPDEPQQPEEDISMEEALAQSFRSFEEGEIVRATVVQVDREGAFVDVGAKTEVKIPLSELSQERVGSAEEVVQVGEEIEVMVVRPRGEEGGPVLSKRLADFERVWQNIVEAYERQETLEAMVTERVKGGLVVDIGVRCFVPASLIGRKLPPQQLDRLIGETLPIKIIDLDHEKRKAVASNVAAEEERRRQQEQAERAQREQLFNQLQIGQRLRGKVKRFAPYGAFIDIGGYEGLLHVSEIGWTRVDHPREALKIGEEIEVVIIRLEPERGKVALSRRQVLPDPWSEITQRYREGEVLQLAISRVERTGAFAKLPEGVEAFIPLSELTSRRGVRNARDVITLGETITARIVEIDQRRRRMVLSVRAAEDQRAMQEHARQRPTAATRSSGFTIAERLPSQLQELQQSLASEEGREHGAEKPARTESEGDSPPISAAEAQHAQPERQESPEQAGIEEASGEQGTTNAE
ncbi:MAG: S1 RNA-binding domain-containing protein [Fimbriimonadales bacterium]|nr:S1 RNA-binding domain-containing protein [Fimbriimonadales bacterium]